MHESNRLVPAPARVRPARVALHPPTGRRIRAGRLVPALAGLPAALLALAVLGLPQEALAVPLLSEVLYDASGSDDGQVFVEIAGVPGFSLDGFTIEGVNGSNGSVGPVVLLSGVIPEDGLFVVADSLSEGGTDVAEADLIVDFDLQNGPDSVLLTDGVSVVDALGYGEFDPDEVFAGEGMPAPDPSAGWSLARVFADIDTDDNATDFLALETPTPGLAVFDTPVPEPGTGLLAGTGLLVLGWMRRGTARRARVTSR